MRSVRDIPEFYDVPILVRSGLDVPIVHGEVRSTYRLRRALMTIRFLQKKGARIIMCGHIGRDPLLTLRPVYDFLREKIHNIYFSDVVCGPSVHTRVHNLQPGEVLLLENLRRNPGEVQGDSAFAKELASLADFFVQDAFDSSHRPHASIVGIPEYLSSYAGLLFEEEVSQLTQSLRPASPSLSILGGAKFATKEPLIAKLQHIYDTVFIGGALGNDLLEARGYEVGKSLVSGKSAQLFSSLENEQKLVGPVDVVVSSRGGKKVAALTDVTPDDTIYDAGPETVRMVQEYMRRAKTILWNGPLGNYERGYDAATQQLLLFAKDLSARVVLGGGDTVFSIEQLGLEKYFTFISTGGGAMLKFLTDETLPGIEAIS